MPVILEGIIGLQVNLTNMKVISISNLLETLDPGVVVTLEDIALLVGAALEALEAQEEMALGALEALGDHQDQEEMILEIITLGHITVHHRGVEISNIQQQLQEDLIRLDLGLAPLQEYRTMEELLNRLEGILTLMEPLQYSHHMDHLVTIVVFPVTT